MQILIPFYVLKKKLEILRRPLTHRRPVKVSGNTIKVKTKERESWTLLL